MLTSCMVSSRGNRTKSIPFSCNTVTDTYIHMYVYIYIHGFVITVPFLKVKTFSIIWPIADRLSPSEQKRAIYRLILLQRTCSSHCDRLRQRVG